jgi:hypothetical protein
MVDPCDWRAAGHLRRISTLLRREADEETVVPWITSNVFKQAPTESLLHLPSFSDAPANIRFRHVVHFYRDAAVPENNEVQRLTFATILEARRLARPKYRVVPVAVTFPVDADIVPAEFTRAAPLDRVVTDMAKFTRPRPLPLLFDILERGANAQVPPGDEEEFFVMTNSDIHLQPNFYLAVGELIAKGYDVITINRRTVHCNPLEPLSSLMLAEHGIDHPGFDCFVFPSRMLPSLVPSRAACGGGHVMRSLIFNLVAQAQRFLMVCHAHLTFHIGDSPRQGPKSDYIVFNVAEAQSVIDRLTKDPEKARRLADFISAHEGSAYRAPTATSNPVHVAQGRPDSVKPLSVRQRLFTTALRFLRRESRS